MKISDFSSFFVLILRLSTISKRIQQCQWLLSTGNKGDETTENIHLLSLNPHLTTGHKLKIIGKVKSCLPSIRYKAYGDTDKHPAVQLDTNRDQIGKHARKNLVRMGSKQLGPCCFVSRSSHTSPATTQRRSCLTPGNLFLLLSSVGHGESSMAWSFCFELFRKNDIWKPRRAGEQDPLPWNEQGKVHTCSNFSCPRSEV